MDDNYQTYLNRLTRMTLPEAYRSQWQQIQTSAKFVPQSGGGRQAVSFPGYTAITPPWEDESDNTDFYTHLKTCQEQLLAQIAPGLIVALPPESFHLTLADLICDEAYRRAIRERPEYEMLLHRAIDRVFREAQPGIQSENPPRWQLLGLIVMPRALGVGLVPADESSYDRVIQLRQALYRHPEIIASGIEQQYHFTAHVTLGYFGDIPSSLDCDRLADLCWQFHQQWRDRPPQFWVRRVELHKFEEMTRYDREPDWPVLEFQSAAQIR
jgi:hypothetical protein